MSQLECNLIFMNSSCTIYSTQIETNLNTDTAYERLLRLFPRKISDKGNQKTKDTCTIMHK